MWKENEMKATPWYGPPVGPAYSQAHDLTWGLVPRELSIFHRSLTMWKKMK